MAWQHLLSRHRLWKDFSASYYIIGMVKISPALKAEKERKNFTRLIIPNGKGGMAGFGIYNLRQTLLFLSKEEEFRLIREIQ